MSWTAPKTFVDLDPLTAAELNVYLRDNTNYLYAQDLWGVGFNVSGVPSALSADTSHNYISTDSLLANGTLSGLAGGTAGRQFLYINRNSSFVLTINHNHSGTATASRFWNLATSAPTRVAPGGYVHYLHDGIMWRMIGHDQGEAIWPAYSASDFTGDATAWTVDAGDVGSMKYVLRGRSLTVSFALSTTTVAAGNSQLRIGFGAYGGYMGASIVYTALGQGYNASVSNPGLIFMNATAFLALIKNNSSQWTADTNLSYFYGQITFDVT